MWADVYIVKAKDVVWSGKGNGIGNAPESLSPYFPSTNRREYWGLIDRVNNGVFQGSQVDWGCWAGRVKKKDIIGFINEVYREDSKFSSLTGQSYFSDELTDIREFVKKLDDETDYALIARES